MIESTKKHFAKPLIVLAIIFGIRLFFSCTPNDFDPMEMDYNSLSTSYVDNSNVYLSYFREVDTSFSEAVAIKLTLSDTSQMYKKSLSAKLQQAVSFRTSQADDWSPTYIPRNRVSELNVRTLFPVNASIDAGDDVTKFFLYAGGSFAMYSHLDKAIETLNRTQSYDRLCTIVLVLAERVENTKAQFELTVTFENGDKLVSTTPVLTIIQQ